MMEDQKFLKSFPLHFQEHLLSLNSTQKKAIFQTQGPILLLAGAGTGKTRVLTTRLAFIYLQGLAQAHNILAVTFTNKAAQEIRERVMKLVGSPIGGMWLGTFHSIGVRFLRYHGDEVGIRADYTILDTDDQLRLIQQIMRSHHWDEKRYPPRFALSLIHRWKDKALRPEQVQGVELGDTQPFYQDLYKHYQDRLRTLNGVDFGDLMLLMFHGLNENPQLLQKYQRQFRYILVDEYQDVNSVQYLWLRLLAQGQENIFCVGDDDQSIYGWRGADVKNILRFEKDFPGASVLFLDQNYRSTPSILGAASGLISHNQNRWVKTIHSCQMPGEKVVVRGLLDGAEEARWVGQSVQSQMIQHNVSASSIAILVRSGFQTREFEERFIQIGLPYQVIGGMRFYERLEIRDALAYLRVIVQPDDSLAFERVLGAPKRGIGVVTIKMLHQVAQDQRISLEKAASQLVETNRLRPHVREILQDFLKDIQRWRSYSLAPGILAQMILDESGYLAFWKKEKSLEATGRLENLKEFVKALNEFETLKTFLDHVSLVMDQVSASGAEKISIMTLHAAKGLEFDRVFLAGWEEDLFPHQRTLEEHSLQGLEEERRLAYVGLTRAKLWAGVSFAWNRRLHQGWRVCMPSRFIQELPQEHTDLTCIQMSRPDFSTQSQQQDYGLPLSERLSGQHHDHFHPGQPVYHEKFGTGAVIAQVGNHLDIAFQDVGRKKIMASFVQRIQQD